VSLGRSRRNILDIPKRAEFQDLLLAVTAPGAHTAERAPPARTQADPLRS
jgi:hypothetical protein